MSESIVIDGDDTIPTLHDESINSHSQQNEMKDDNAAATADSQQVDTYSSSRALAPITIRLGTTTTAASIASSPHLHLLPCRIAHTGPANIPNYFRPHTATKRAPLLQYGVNGVELVESGDCQEASFRGRQMIGQKVDLPQTASGFIFEEDENHAIEIDAEENTSAGTTEERENDDENNNNNDNPTSSSHKAPQTIWKVASTFSSFMLWQPDQELSERKHIKETISDWTEIARAIHEPIL